MLRVNYINAVVKLLQKENIQDKGISPNRVALIAYNNKIELSSEEVVYISDNYNLYGKLI